MEDDEELSKMTMLERGGDPLVVPVITNVLIIARTQIG